MCDCKIDSIYFALLLYALCVLTIRATKSNTLGPLMVTLKSLESLRNIWFCYLRTGLSQIKVACQKANQNKGTLYSLSSSHPLSDPAPFLLGNSSLSAWSLSSLVKTLIAGWTLDANLPTSHNKALQAWELSGWTSSRVVLICKPIAVLGWALLSIH